MFFMEKLKTVNCEKVKLATETRKHREKENNFLLDIVFYYLFLRDSAERSVASPEGTRYQIMFLTRYDSRDSAECNVASP